MNPTEFINDLYGDADTGWLSFFFLPSKKVQWTKLLGKIPRIEKTENCYLGLGLRRNLPGDESERGKLEDVIGIPGLWLDLDYESEGAHKAKIPLPPDEKSCLDMLNAGPCEPSLIINSGHGLQVYWLFNEVWYFDDLEREKAIRLCRGWQAWWQDTAKESGWHVDSTADLTRVFRLPGTKNTKTKPYKDVILVKKSPKRYEPSDFNDYISLESLPTISVSPNGLTPRRVDILGMSIISDRTKYLILHGDTLKKYPSRSEAVFSAINGLIGAGCEDDEIAGALLDEQFLISEMPREKGERWLAFEIARARQKGISSTSAGFGGEKIDDETEPKIKTYSLVDILGMKLPELVSPISKFLHEGLWIFGGKSKRGKSWLMLDLALAVSSGQLAFGALETNRTKVLYICLEDGVRRVRSRMMQFDLDTSKEYDLQVAFSFPGLKEGGRDLLTAMMQEYGLIIVDVATRIMPRRSAKSDPYADTYDDLTPLHDAANKYHCTLILIDHLRKSAAEDVFDEIHGSVAKQGVADALMVLERAPRENELLLHMRGKEFGEMIHALYFNGRNFQYRGEGDSFALKASQQKIIDILLEESPDFMSISDIQKAMGLEGNAHYHSVRRSIILLEKDGFIGTMQVKGRKVYGAMARSKYERIYGEAPQDIDNVPF